VIDWLYTKIGVFIASIMLLVSLLGLLSAMNGVLRDSQAENIATRVAETIDGIGAARGELRLTVTVARPGEREGLPRTLLGEPYGLRVFWDSVWVVRASDPDRPWRTAPLLHPLYTSPAPTDPTEADLRILEIRSLTAGFTVDPLRDFSVDRRLVTTDHGASYRTFIYL